MFKLFLLFLRIIFVHDSQEYPKYILYAEKINGDEYINYFEVNSKQEEDAINDLIFRKISTINICKKMLNSSLFCNKSKKSVKKLFEFVK